MAFDRNEYMKKYRAANKEKVAEQSKKYREKKTSEKAETKNSEGGFYMDMAIESRREYYREQYKKHAQRLNTFFSDVVGEAYFDCEQSGYAKQFLHDDYGINTSFYQYSE